MPPPTIDVANPPPPPTANDVDLMPPPEGEVVAHANPKAFGGGIVDLSLLSLYPNHTVKHIMDGEVTLVGFIIFYVNFN